MGEAEQKGRRKKKEARGQFEHRTFPEKEKRDTCCYRGGHCASRAARSASPQAGGRGEDGNVSSRGKRGTLL